MHIHSAIFRVSWACGGGGGQIIKPPLCRERTRALPPAHWSSIYQHHSFMPQSHPSSQQSSSMPMKRLRLSLRDSQLFPHRNRWTWGKPWVQGQRGTLKAIDESHGRKVKNTSGLKNKQNINWLQQTHVYRFYMWSWHQFLLWWLNNTNGKSVVFRR